MEVREESDGRQEGDVLRNQFTRGCSHWKETEGIGETEGNSGEKRNRVRSVSHSAAGYTVTCEVRDYIWLTLIREFHHVARISS